MCHPIVQLGLMAAPLARHLTALAWTTAAVAEAKSTAKMTADGVVKVWGSTQTNNFLDHPQLCNFVMSQLVALFSGYPYAESANSLNF